MGINILQTIPPNVSIMKRLLFGILATLPLAYCMTGCSNDTDYGGFSYFIWANDSDHRITLSVAREYGELVIENEIIEPGESFESERVDGAIAYCPPPSSYIRYVEVVFEDGTKAIYIKGYQPPRDSDYYSRQDSTIDWNYEEEERHLMRSEPVGPILLPMPTTMRRWRSNSLNRSCRSWL